MNTKARKPAAELSRDEILDMLVAFVCQRPGFEPGNYATSTDYRRDVREATRDRNEALQMLRLIRYRDVITADDMRAALKSRLCLDADGRLDYNAGQYWCTEFRAAVANVASSLIWSYFAHEVRFNADGEGRELAYGEVANGCRKKARQEFGRAMAARWFR